MPLIVSQLFLWKTRLRAGLRDSNHGNVSRMLQSLLRVRPSTKSWHPSCCSFAGTSDAIQPIERASARFRTV